MASITALQLVNRVRRNIRAEDKSIVTDDLGKAILDDVNRAKHQILDGQDWDFDVRHDGVLMTVATANETGNVTVTAGSLNGTVDTPTAYSATNYATGDFKTHVVVESDTSFADTAFGITNSAQAGTLHAFGFDTTWPGTTSSTANAKFFVTQYRLPDTVREVVRVRHQENDINLVFLNVSRPFPVRPHALEQDVPETIYVGSQVTATYDSASVSSAEIGLGMMLSSPTTSSIRLDYSYRYRHPDLTVATDSISGVPNNVIDEVAELASAFAYTSMVANDPQLGAAAKQDVYQSVARQQSQDDPAPHRRRELSQHDGPRLFSGGWGHGPKNPRAFHSE